MRIRDVLNKLINCTDLDAEFVVGNPDDSEEQRDVASIREDSDGNAVVEIDV